MGRPKRFARRWFPRLLLGAAVGIWLLPYLLASPMLRSRVVGAAVAPSGLRAAVGGASFGWLSPLSVDHLRLATAEGAPLAAVERFTAEMPWWKLALAYPHLGHFDVLRPRVELIVGDEGTNFRDAARGGSSGGSGATLDVTVRDGSLRIRHAATAPPIARWEHVDLALRIERAGADRVVSIAPTTLFERQRLTPELCREALRWIAPELANATDIEGRVSLRLDEFRLPIQRSEGRSVKGRLQFRGVQAVVKDPWLSAVARLVGTALRTDLPMRVRIVEEAEVRFHVEGERVYHQGLALALPSLAPDLIVRTRGSVGWDESLDLKVHVAGLPPLIASRGGPGAASEGGLELTVGGTLGRPTVHLPRASTSVARWLDRAVDRELDHRLPPETRPLVDGLLRELGHAMRSGGVAVHGSRNKPPKGADGR